MDRKAGGCSEALMPGSSSARMAHDNIKEEEDDDDDDQMVTSMAMALEIKEIANAEIEVNLNMNMRMTRMITVRAEKVKMANMKS